MFKMLSKCVKHRENQQLS